MLGRPHPVERTARIVVALAAGVALLAGCGATANRVATDPPATREPASGDLWVVQGRYGFHMSHLRRSGIPLDQMVAPGKAMVAGLSR